MEGPDCLTVCPLLAGVEHCGPEPGRAATMRLVLIARCRKREIERETRGGEEKRRREKKGAEKEREKKGKREKQVGGR